MGLDKFNQQSDALVNLYRAALYLAKGSKEVGLKFLARANERIGKRFDKEIILLFSHPEKSLKSTDDCLYWAERILDQYLKFKHAVS